VDHLPFAGSLLELVGLLVSATYAWRLVTDEKER